MALKLLKPSEAKTAEEARRQEDIRRADSLTHITQGLLEERTNAEQRFEETLETQRMRWEQEESAHRAAALQLQRAVEELEERQERSLIPIVKREQQLHNSEEALTVRELAVCEREASLEDNARALMSRLDEVSDRENAATALAQSLNARKSGIDAQEKQTRENARAIAVQMATFESSKRQHEHELSKEKAIIAGRTLALDEKEKHLSALDEDLRIRELRLQDRFAMLERTRKELSKT